MQGRALKEHMAIRPLTESSNNSCYPRHERDGRQVFFRRSWRDFGGPGTLFCPGVVAIDDVALLRKGRAAWLLSYPGRTWRSLAERATGTKPSEDCSC